MKTSIRQVSWERYPGFVIVILAFAISLLTRCTNCNRGDRPESLTEANFGFELLEAKTGKNLFTNQMYSIDSVRLINSKVNSLRKVRSGIGEYAFGIDSIYNSVQNQIGQRVDRTYYLYLNHADTDTLRLSFLPVAGECYPYFTDYQVFYNQRLINTSQNTVSFFT